MSVVVRAGTGGWLHVPDDDTCPPPVPFTGPSGQKHPPKRDAKPLQYFKLLFSHELMDIIATETNRYAGQWMEVHTQFLRNKPKSLVNEWIKVGKTSAKELYAFVAVVLSMGLIRKPTIRSYWIISDLCCIQRQDHCLSYL